MYLEYRIEPRPPRYRPLQEMLCLQRMREFRGHQIHNVRAGLRHGAELSLNYRTIFRNGHQAKRSAQAFAAWREHWPRALRPQTARHP